MANYNRVVMIGNLTRDPEYKTLPSGQSVCRLGLASNRQFKNRQTGTMIQEVCYVDIDVWGAQAESCRQYLQKGRAVLIEGRLKFDTWQDQNGSNRSKHSIVADRVVFLSQAASQEVSDETGSSVGAAQRDPNAQLEKELLDQIEDIKTRASKKQEGASAAPAQKVEASKEKKMDNASQMAGVEFKDEPPFQDDLPF